MTFKRLLVLLTPLLLWMGADFARAAEPSGGGSSGGSSDPIPLETRPDRDRNTGTGNLSGRPELNGIFVQGSVTDAAGQALQGIKIKLFSGGFLVSTTDSDAEGRFKITGNPAIAEDRALDLWFASPDSRWVDASVALSSSSKPK